MTTDAAEPLRDAGQPRRGTAAGPAPESAPGAGQKPAPGRVTAGGPADAAKSDTARHLPPDRGTAPPEPIETRHRAWLDLASWGALVAVGLGITALAVHSGARLGTASAPFLGAYRFQLTPLSLLAPLVAALVVAIAVSGALDRLRWRIVVTLSYLAALAWAFSLALADGASGLTRSLRSQMNYAPDIASLDNHPLHYIATYTATSSRTRSPRAAIHPARCCCCGASSGPGSPTWLTVGVLITVLGVLTVPLVLHCGTGRVWRGDRPPVHRRSWSWRRTRSGSRSAMDGVVAMLGALAIAAGVYASARARTGSAAPAGRCCAAY